MTYECPSCHAPIEPADPDGSPFQVAECVECGAVSDYDLDAATQANDGS